MPTIFSIEAIKKCKNPEPYKVLNENGNVITLSGNSHLLLGQYLVRTSNINGNLTVDYCDKNGRHGSIRFGLTKDGWRKNAETNSPTPEDALKHATQLYAVLATNETLKNLKRIYPEPDLQVEKEGFYHYDLNEKPLPSFTEFKDKPEGPYEEPERPLGPSK